MKISKTFAALCLLAVEHVANAGCENSQHCEDYPEFAQMMKDHAGDYTWIAHEVTTEDGYHLTMFQIVGDANNERQPGQGKKGQLLLLPGFAQDSQIWFDQTNPNQKTLPQRLFDKKFDVWFGNFRGQTYSKGHDDFPSEDASNHGRWYYTNYWDFNNDDVAENDIPAMVKKMDEQNIRCKKMTILSYAEGSSIVMNSLSKAERAHEYIGQAINLEPCFIGNKKIVPYAPDNFSHQWNYSTRLRTYNKIASAFGANWTRQLQNMCTDPEQTWCPSEQQLPATYSGNEFSMKQAENFIMSAWTSNWLTNYDATYQGDWGKYYYNGEKIHPEDVSEKIAVRALWSNGDVFCGKDHQAESEVLNFPSYHEEEDQFIEGPHGSSLNSNKLSLHKQILQLVLPNAGDKAAQETCDQLFDFGL